MFNLQCKSLKLKSKTAAKADDELFKGNMSSDNALENRWSRPASHLVLLILEKKLQVTNEQHHSLV